MGLSFAEFYLFSICYHEMSITYYEYVEIIGSLKTIWEPRFRCFDDTEISRLPNPILAKEQKDHLNCCNRVLDRPPSPSHKHDNLEFLTCPCNYYNPEIETLFEIYRDYDKFGLSALRNIYNNKDNYISSKLFDIIKIIESFVKYKNKQEEERQKAKQKKGNK